MQSITTHEKALFSRVADGDETAFNELFHLYHKRFYAAAVKMTRSGQAAEELVQDVFVTLWTKRAELQHMERPFSYLFTILYNSIYRHLRQLALEKRRIIEAGASLNDIEDPVEELLLAKEHEAIIRKAIGQLPEQQRRVYQLIKQQGMSREEAAQAMGISPNTVRNHLSEAVNNLRTYLKRALPLLLHILLMHK